MEAQPLVSIIIPHLQGSDVLLRCLRAVMRCAYPAKEVLLVDNASTDGSVARATELFSEIRVIRQPENRGYAGGCNAGMQAAAGQYYLLLNDDAVLDEMALARLVEAAEQDEKIAAVQPKIRSISQPNAFDYAGAAGGFLDIFAFPFARGRLFFTLEADAGQYDTAGWIFWASGTCTLLRASAVDRVGNLDETFFAHMEEIDLNWRMHLAGFDIWFAPAAVVYHDAGSTLRPDSPQKIYLNHRNSLAMMLKNYAASTLLWIFPIRLLLEGGAALFALARRDVRQAAAVCRGTLAVLKELRHIRRERRRVRALRVLRDRQLMQRMYRRSIVLAYFVFGKKTFDCLGIAEKH